jgi:hypothetical protein
MNKNWLKELEKINPFKIYKIKDVSFLIYKAKNLYSPKWNSHVLKQITQEARKSFLRYGPMPLINEYDKNAEVYLCRAVDKTNEEWLSLRFVPGKDGAVLVEDLLQYNYKNIPISNLIADKLFGEKNFHSKMVSISRICGIYPYVREVEKTNRAKFFTSLKYVARSFGLINKVFFSQHDFVYLTATVRKELLKKVLRFNNKISLYLPDAHKIIGCASSDVRLNRSLLAYRFPGYFLDILQLINLLERLIKEGKLSLDSVKAFIKFYKPNFKKKLKEKKYIEVLKEIKGLEKLLLLSGIIPKAKITGEELRGLIAKHVSDGPILKIIPVSKWKKQLEKIKI